MRIDRLSALDAGRGLPIIRTRSSSKIVWHTRLISSRDSSSSSTKCAECGSDRSEVRAVPAEKRPPCPDCGATALVMTETLSAEVRISTDITTGLTPGRQDRDWKLRWEQLDFRLPQVIGSRPGERGEREIHAAAQDLMEFFVSAYHLKDALIQDGVVARTAVEEAIDDSETLALLADLANLDKHTKLTKKPRSGDVPIIERVSDVSTKDEWRLRMVIRHKGSQIDGASFAQAAIDEWRSYLKKWGLVE